MRGELVELLGQHAEPNRGADLHAAARGCELALDHLQERGLSRTVLSEQAVAVARADEPCHIGQHGRGSPLVAGIDVDHVDHLLAQAAHRQALQLELVAHGRDVGDELARRLDAELGLGAARLSTAGEPGELLAGHVAAALLGGRSHAVALDALQDVGGVAALEGVDAAVVDLPHRGAHLIEEPAVVCHDEQRAGPGTPALLEMRREPIDRAHVEMVGGLIEHEDVIGADEQPRQVDAPALPARKLPHRPLPGHVGDEAVEDLSDARLRGPFVLGHVADDGAVDGRGVIERIFLPEQADRDVPSAGDASAVGLYGAGEHREQRRLAVAVPADDADPVPLVHAEGDGIEDMLGGKLEPHRIASQKDRHIPCSSSDQVASALHPSTRRSSRASRPIENPPLPAARISIWGQAPN